MTKDKEVDAYIANAAAEHKEILTTLRALIEKSVPNATEHFKWSQPVYETKKGFCYLKSTKKHVNLGFMNFGKIDDPENLLEGTGKSMRHIKIRSMEDIREEVFGEMLRQGAEF